MSCFATSAEGRALPDPPVRRIAPLERAAMRTSGETNPRRVRSASVASAKTEMPPGASRTLAVARAEARRARRSSRARAGGPGAAGHRQQDRTPAAARQPVRSSTSMADHHAGISPGWTAPTATQMRVAMTAATAPLDRSDGLFPLYAVVTARASRNAQPERLIGEEALRGEGFGRSLADHDAPPRVSAPFAFLLMRPARCARASGSRTPPAWCD